MSRSMTWMAIAGLAVAAAAALLRGDPPRRERTGVPRAKSPTRTETRPTGVHTTMPRGSRITVTGSDGRTEESFDAIEDQEYREALVERARRLFERTQEAFREELAERLRAEGPAAVYALLKEASGGATGRLESRARALLAVDFIRSWCIDYPEHADDATATLARLARDPATHPDVREASLATLLGFQAVTPHFSAPGYSWRDGRFAFDPRPEEAGLLLPYEREDLGGDPALGVLRARLSREFAREVLLLAISSHEPPALRTLAIIGLSELDIDVSPLRRIALSEDWPRARLESLRTLAKRDTDAEATLMEVARAGGDSWVRAEAVQLLAHRPSAVFDDLLRQIHSIRPEPDDHLLHAACLLASRESYARTRDPNMLAMILDSCDRYSGVLWSGRSPIRTLAERVVQDGPPELAEALRRFAPR